MRFRKNILALLAILLLVACTSLAYAWEKEGSIPTTELTFSELTVSKKGVSLKLTNTSHTPIKISARLTFYDQGGNTIGYTVFGLREIPEGSYVNIAENYLNGNWRKCRDAYRTEWRPMTYELVY